MQIYLFFFFVKNINFFNLNIYSIASDSKIAFIDVQVGSDGLTIPSDLSKYFDKMKDYKSIISSNSWGAEYYKYSSETYMIDSYAYTHPEMVILFAAGNEGELSYLLLLLLEEFLLILKHKQKMQLR